MASEEGGDGEENTLPVGSTYSGSTTSQTSLQVILIETVSRGLTASSLQINKRRLAHILKVTK